MARISNGSRYLDLFDDDLYRFGPHVNQDLYNDHLNNIRLQIMAYILLNGSIVVPEQWLVSSPTFCRVAGEVLTPWLKMRSAPKLLPPELRRPPIIPAFSDASAAFADERLLHSLETRLRAEGGSPIRLAPELDTDNEYKLDVARRERFRLGVSKLLSLPRADRVNNFHSRECFEEHIGDEQLGLSFFVLHNCLYQASENFVGFDKMQYRRLLDHKIANVAHAVFNNGEIGQIDSTKIKAWQEFFLVAKSKKINLSSITALRRILNEEGFSAIDNASIETVGRHCMHAALAEVSEGEVTSMSYTMYEAIKPGQFEHALIQDLRSNLTSSAEPQAEENIAVVDSIESLYHRGSKNKVCDTIDWGEVWENFWDFKVKDEWKRDRNTIISSFNRKYHYNRWWEEEKSYAYILSEWDYLFERLSKQLRFIHFVRNPEDARYANIVIRASNAPSHFEKFTETMTKVVPSIASFSAAAAFPALSVPLMVMGGAMLMVGPGVGWGLSSNRAKAGLQLGAEKVFGYTQVRR